MQKGIVFRKAKGRQLLSIEPATFLHFINQFEPDEKGRIVFELEENFNGDTHDRISHYLKPWNRRTKIDGPTHTKPDGPTNYK